MNEEKPLQSAHPSVNFSVNQHEFKWWRRVTWGAVVTVATAVGFVGNCGLARFDASNTAMAQTSARADTALEVAREAKAQVQMVDAGTRAAIERLERKIDANNEAAARDREKAATEREKDRELMRQVLATVKKL